MGEYAKYKGKDIKIGTCGDMYYLRAGDRSLVRYEWDTGGASGGFASCLGAIRFRFPFPDEDGVEPGDYADYSRSIPVDKANLTIPDCVDHYSIQFSNRKGLLVSLPCPNSKEQIEGVKIHKNGYAGDIRLGQVAYREGAWRPILECGACGVAYWTDAEVVAEAFKDTELGWRLRNLDKVCETPRLGLMATP